MKKFCKWYEEKGIWLIVFVALIIAILVPSPSKRFAQEEETTPIYEAEVVDYYIYDVPLACEIQHYIGSLCEDYGVDSALVMAIIKVESNYRIDVIGDSGNSYGLMQIQAKWHGKRMERLGVTDLLNPYENVTVGVDYIAEKLHEGLGVEWALMAYNGGNDYANRKVANGEVTDYALKVMAEAYKLTTEKKYGGIGND